MRLDGEDDLLIALHRQPDTVRDIQTGGTAGRLDHPDHVTSDALALQLRRHPGVEHEEVATAQHPHGATLHRSGLTGHQVQRVLPRDQLDAAGGDGAVISHRPVTGLRALDDRLHLLAQTRTGRPGIDGQALLDAHPLGLLAAHLEQAHRLHVQLLGDDRGERLQQARVVVDDGQLGQREAGPQALLLAQRVTGAGHHPHLLHSRDQLIVRRELCVLRPIRQMHGAAAGQLLPDLLGDHRQQRGRHPDEGLQAGREHIDGLLVALPEAVAGAAHIPVGEHVQVALDVLGGVGDRQVLEVAACGTHQLPGTGQQIAVHHVGGLVTGPAAVAGRSTLAVLGAGRIGIHRQEVPDVPQRQHRLADRVADPGLVHDQVAAAQDRRAHQEPAHRIGPVGVVHLAHIGVVAQRLAHLLPVLTQHDAVADDAGEGGTVEQGGGQHVHHVEPTAGLPDVLDDEVGRVVRVEPLGVVEGVVHLCEGHRPGVEPDVEDVAHPAHAGGAARIVGVGPGEVVDVGAVQVDLAVLIARQGAEGLLHLRQRPVDLDARVFGVVALPHRDGGPPVAVAGDRPVPGALEPLAELAVLDIARHPVDLLVQLQHPLALVGDLHEPGADRLVDQRVPAAPAVGVGVDVAALAQQSALAAQVPDDRAVRLEDLQPGDVVQRGAAEVLVELGALVDRDDHGDAVGGVDLLVLLTEGSGLVDHAGAVSGGDVVGHGDDPGVLGAPLLAVGGVDVPQRLVGHVLQLGAGELALRGRGQSALGVVVAELGGVGTEQILGQQVAGGARLGAVARPIRAGRDAHVDQLGADGQREVGGQGPGGRGPGQRPGAVQAQLGGPVAGQREGDGDGGILAILVDVVVHAQLVRGQGGLVLPAVRQHRVALVGAVLVVQGLESPQHRLHEGGAESLVVVLEVDPAGLPLDVLLPLLGVLQHRTLGGGVELPDAHRLDLGLLGHAQLAHGLELGGQPVGVPAEATLDPASRHGAEPRHHVLDEPGQQVAVVGQAIGEGGPVVEDVLLSALSLGDRSAEGVIASPEREDAVLELRQVR